MSTAPPPAGGGATDGDFTLAFRLDGGCLRAQVTGVLASLERILAMFLAVAAEVRRSGATLMLMVDETRRDVPDAAQFLLLVQGVEGAGFAGVRIAYVDTRGGAIVRLQANELVAREHGYTLKVFDSEPLAAIWLRYGVE